MDYARKEASSAGAIRAMEHKEHERITMRLRSPNHLRLAGHVLARESRDRRKPSLAPMLTGWYAKLPKPRQSVLQTKLLLRW